MRLKQLVMLAVVTVALYAGSAYQKVVLGTFYSLEDAQKSLKKLWEDAGEAVEANQAAYGYELLARASGDLFIVVAEPVESYSDAKLVAEFFYPYYGAAQILRYSGSKQPGNALTAEEENSPETERAAAVGAPKFDEALPERETEAAEPARKMPQEKREAAETAAKQSAETAEAELKALQAGGKHIRELVTSMDEPSRKVLFEAWSGKEQKQEPTPPAPPPAVPWKNALIVLLLAALALLGWRYRLLQRRHGRHAVPAVGSEAAEAAEEPAADTSAAEEEDPAASIAHEVRTSARIILGHLRGLRKIADASVQQHVEDIEKRAVLLQRLVDQVEAAGGVRRSWALERYDFNLNDVLEGISRLIAARAMESGDEVLFMVDKEVPIQLAGDGMRLQQVLLSIIENALDATENGVISLNVEHIVTVGSWTTLSFAVEDTGSGMDEKVLKRLFEEKIDGSDPMKGPGLQMDRELIKMMGGTLNIKSEVGKGSYIYFTANFNVQSSMERRKYRLPDEKGFERKLLVVDSNKTAADSLRRKLQYFKLPVDAVYSWEDATQLLNLHADAYGHLFINETLLEGPQQDAMIKKLDGIYAEPIIVTYDKGRFDGRFEHPVAYLEKPFSMQRVLSLLRELAMDRSTFTSPKVGKELHDDEVSSLLDPPLWEDEEFAFEGEETFLELDGRHILLVDGNRTNQGILTWILEEAGLTTTIVASADEAMEQLDASRNAFDMILLDVQIPFEEHEVVEALHGGSGAESLPIIAMSTTAPENVGTWIKMNHFDGYLQKPIYKEDLFDLLKEVLYRRAAAQKS